MFLQNSSSNLCEINASHHQYFSKTKQNKTWSILRSFHFTVFTPYFLCLELTLLVCFMTFVTSTVSCLQWLGHLPLLTYSQHMGVCWGTMGPPGGENFAHPPNRLASPLFDQSLHVPPTEFCPQKFQKFYLIFLSILTSLAQNCIRNLSC